MTRFPTSVAVANAALRKLPPCCACWLAWSAVPPGVDSRVSRLTLVVFHRNFPASAKTDCPGSSWHVTCSENPPVILVVNVIIHLAWEVYLQRHPIAWATPLIRSSH